MTNETPVTEETTSTFDALKDKVRQLPWKKIAIAAAVTTVAAIVVSNREKLTGESYVPIEIEIDSVNPDGSIDFTVVTPED